MTNIYREVSYAHGGTSSKEASQKKKKKCFKYFVNEPEGDVLLVFLDGFDDVAKDFKTAVDFKRLFGLDAFGYVKINNIITIYCPIRP